MKVLKSIILLAICAMILAGCDSTSANTSAVGEKVLVDAEEYASLLRLADIQETTVALETQAEIDVPAYHAPNGSNNNTTKYVAAPEPSPNATDYIANLNTKKFHYPSCSSVDQMKESNKWYFTGTRDELISQGYDPCQRCKP